MVDWAAEVRYSTCMKKVYNELVRDRMIDIYKRDVAEGIFASDYSVHYLEPKETLELLKDELLEESKEVFEAYGKEDKAELKEEFADMIEVVDAILHHNDIELEGVLQIRDEKKVKKGGSEEGLFLEYIEYVDGQEK